MSKFKETIPKELVLHTIAICGERGEKWLDELAGTIRELEDLWSIQAGEAFSASEFNYVASATTSDGQRAVIKLAPPYNNCEILSEAAWLRNINGSGAVKLLAEDLSRRAILLERAVPGKNLAELFTGDEMSSLEPAISVLQKISCSEVGDVAKAIQLDDWFDRFRRSLCTAFPTQYVSRAIELYDGALNLANVPRVYLHGDFHPGNIVSASRSEYLAIDPKGVIGPLGYDIAVFLNNFHWWQEHRSDVRARLSVAIERFSTAFGIGQMQLRQWAFVQMVLSAWWNFDERPSIYDNEVAKADIWDV